MNFRSHNADMSYTRSSRRANACVCSNRDNDQSCATASFCCSMRGWSMITTPRIHAPPSRDADSRRPPQARGLRGGGSMAQSAAIVQGLARESLESSA